MQVFMGGSRKKIVKGGGAREPNCFSRGFGPIYLWKPIATCDFLGWGEWSVAVAFYRIN